MKAHTWSLLPALVLLLAASSVSAQSARARADRHHEQAAAYYRVEAYEDAIEEWKQSYELHPNPNRLFNIGRAYEELGDLENAVEYYRRYVNEDPDGRAVTEANARIRRLERELEAMRAENERRAAITEARARMSERDYDAAIEAYRRAYELSEDPAIVYEVAQAHRLAGNYEQAIEEYARYVEISPEGERAADALAHQQTLERELESAEPDDAAAADATDADVTVRDDATPAPEPAGGGGWSGVRIAGVSSLGVSAVGMGAGVFFGMQARSAQRTVEGAEGSWSRELDDEVARGQAAQRNLIIATAMSGAALAAGGVLLYLDARPAGGGEVGAISLAPALTESSAGLVVGGRF